MARPGWQVRRQQQIRNAIELVLSVVVLFVLFVEAPWIVWALYALLHPGAAQ